MLRSETKKNENMEQWEVQTRVQGDDSRERTHDSSITK